MLEWYDHFSKRSRQSCRILSAIQEYSFCTTVAASPRSSPLRTTSLGATSASQARKLSGEAFERGAAGRGIRADKLGKAKLRDVSEMEERWSRRAGRTGSQSG